MAQEKIKTDGIYTNRFFNFIRKLRVNPENAVVENFLDKGLPQISSYYTPRRELSELAVRTLEDLNRNRITSTKNKTHPDSLPGLVFNSGVTDEYPELLVYFRIVMLEMFSVVYALKYREDLQEYMSDQDIKHTRENINYIVDVLGFDPRYKDLILSLQTVEVELGYIQAQTAKYGWGMRS